MKKIFATSFAFAVASAMLFAVPQSAQALNGACECKIAENVPGNASVPARDSSECTSTVTDGAKVYSDCTWQVAGESGVGICQCTGGYSNIVTQQFRQIPDRQACNTGAVVSQLRATQQVKSCAWVGEDPQLEQGQVFDPRLRNEIKALDKFGGRSIQQVIGLLIKSAMGILGSIALVMFIYGGVMWMTSMGNSHKEDEGKDTVMWAAIGIAVILSSYALVTYLFASIAP